MEVFCRKKPQATVKALCTRFDGVFMYNFIRRFWFLMLICSKRSTIFLKNKICEVLDDRRWANVNCHYLSGGVLSVRVGLMIDGECKHWVANSRELNRVKRSARARYVDSPRFSPSWINKWEVSRASAGLIWRLQLTTVYDDGWPAPVLHGYCVVHWLWSEPHTDLANSSTKLASWLAALMCVFAGDWPGGC